MSGNYIHWINEHLTDGHIFCLLFLSAAVYFDPLTVKLNSESLSSQLEVHAVARHQCCPVKIFNKIWNQGRQSR